MSKRNIKKNVSDRDNTKRTDNFKKTEYFVGHNKFGFKEQINLYWQKRNAEKLRYKNKLK
tara:strand:- start:2286 stop:2465 length:180 start_codon:yes stop_codon:yes gene_type:complete